MYKSPPAAAGIERPVRRLSRTDAEQRISEIAEQTLSLRDMHQFLTHQMPHDFATIFLLGCIDNKMVELRSTAKVFADRLRG